MRIATLALSSLLLTAACGKKEAPAPAPAPAPETKPATPAEPKPAEPKPAEPAAAADATDAPVPEADAGPTAAPPAPAAAAGDDLIVWTTTATGRESLWLRGDEVVATRAEAVTVAQNKLWALGERWRVVKCYACGGEDMMERDTTKPPTEHAVQKLVAKELGGTTEAQIVDAFRDADTELDGEIWSADATLTGSIGGAVFYSWASSLYACGAAHGIGDSSGGAFGVGTQEPVEVNASDALKAKVADALKAAGTKDDCLDADTVIDPVAPDDLSLSFADGRATAAWEANRPADAEWNHVCDLSVAVEVPLDDTLGYGPIDPRVAKVIATRTGRGQFGFAAVPADVKDALLEVFRKSEPTFQPEPVVAAPPEAPAAADGQDAEALVAKGRKLTREKDYPGAIAAFDAAIAKDGKVAPAWSGRGYAKLLAGDASAKADFEKALELETKDVGFQAAVWFNLGQLAEKAKDLAAAKAAYTKAVELKPSEGAKKALTRVSK